MQLGGGQRLRGRAVFELEMRGEQQTEMLEFILPCDDSL